MYGGSDKTVLLELINNQANVDKNKKCLVFTNRKDIGKQSFFLKKWKFVYNSCILNEKVFKRNIKLSETEEIIQINH